jgi:formate hydrogenlyase subunit 6/NADH:ubiquinone oxidoreductase subunit I
MAHTTLKSGYARLTDRLNRFPQGAPPSKLLFSILKMLMDEREAELISLLPIKPFTARDAARAWRMSSVEAQKILERLADRAILVDMDQNGEICYTLPPPMAGFFEFSLMRYRNDIDQRLLSEMFYQYLNVEEDFIRELFTHGETQLGRTFVHEPAVDEDAALYVLSHERATEVIRTASAMAVGVCYCRHKMHHVGRACGRPLEICMTFNTSAKSLIRHGFARRVDVAEGLDLLQKAYDHQLVQFGENVRQGVNFICNCCGCCCEAMIAARRFAIFNPIHTTNFLPEVDPAACVGCGKCAEICPVEAMTLVSANDPARPKRKRAKLDDSICLGCGLCARVCPERNIRLRPRPERVITPLNTTHRVVVMAIERGKLQNLIFDQQVLWHHRALAAVLGVILKLAPVKRAMASEQVKSRYLEAAIRRMNA